MDETRLRRAAEQRPERLGDCVRLWSALDRAGHRPWAARWLDDFRDGETAVVMMFAEGDEGIEYLRLRLSRRLAHVQRRGGLRVVKVERHRPLDASHMATAADDRGLGGATRDTRSARACRCVGGRSQCGVGHQRAAVRRRFRARATETRHERRAQ
jgi:hypothetical protein